MREPTKVSMRIETIEDALECAEVWKDREPERFGCSDHIAALKILSSEVRRPVPMILYCPAGHQHFDEGEWATKPHKTHQCQFKKWSSIDMGVYAASDYVICGLEWRPANFPTVGIAKLSKAGA